MVLKISTVPASIDGEVVKQFLRDLGIVPEETISLRFELSAVEIEVYARDEEGRAFIRGTDVAKHMVTLPITWGPDA